ncbi:hypothetical protein LCGC14_0465740 [marine sediment metagenome]|uniref:Uncharacterized protein n=1 Tax=marine sediment metagenome TaxID=412755 RepID=A0A0F9SDT2_9ZZZZ
MKAKFTLEEVKWYLVIVGGLTFCIGFLLGITIKMANIK